MQLQLQEGKIRCGTFASGLLLLSATGLSCSALFLAFWDGGSAKELLNLEDAPPVVSNLWSISFKNPPPEFIKPKRRDSSTWDEYCAAQSKEPETETSASSSISEVNSTAADSSNATGGNVSNATGANHSGSRRLLPQEDDPPLPDAACFLVVTSRMMMLLSPSLSTAAFITMVIARMRMSVLSALLGAFFSGLSAAAACSAVMLAALLSITGLASGLGTQFVVLAMCLATAAACVAIWASAKAVQPLPGVMRAAGGEAETDSEEEIEEIKAKRKGIQEVKSNQTAGSDSGSRLDRIRKARKREIRKFGHARVAGANAMYGVGNNVTVSEEKMKRIRQIIDDSVPYNLKRIFQWGERKGEGGRFGAEVPDEIIENAFAEIDADDSGEISLDEFMMAVRKLGLEPSEEAFRAILEQVDSDGSGTMEYTEFYRFFRTLEETIREGAHSESQAALFSFFCQLCFFVHVIIISVTVIASSRRPPATEELDAIKQSERNLMDTLVQIIAVNLCILFWCVVGIPMVRFSLGRSLNVWTTLFAEALYSCCRRCRQRVPEQAEVEPDASDVEVGKHAQDGDDHADKHSPEVEDHVELPALHESKEIDSPSEEAYSPPASPSKMSSSPKGPKGKKKRSSTAKGDGGDTAIAQQGRLRKKTLSRSQRSTSRPWWKRLFSRRGNEAQKSNNASGRRSTSPSRATTKRGTVVHSPLNKSSRSTISRSTRIRKTKMKEEWTGEVEDQYNPQRFQDANRIYMEALSAPVSTFTPMQVRNLSYRPPDHSSPVPPEETHVPTLFLPGMTDASFHERQLERSGSQYSQ